MAYTYFNDPRNWVDSGYTPNLRGSKYMFKDAMESFMGSLPKRRSPGKFKLSKARRTKTYKRSAVKQKTITAPQSRTIDTKYLDLKQALSGLKNTAPIAYIVGEVPQGSAEGQRIGNDIRVIKYIVTFEIAHGSSTLDATYRIIMARYKTGNSNTDPGIGTLIDSDANSNRTPLSLRNVPSLEDWEILLDDTIVIDNNYAASHGLRCRNYCINTAFPQRYSGAASTTVIRNPVFVYIVTNVANTTTGATGQLNIRTIFADI